MHAIIETGGKQYRVAQGDILFVEKLNAEPEQVITLNRVLMVEKEGGAVVGSPIVEGASVSAKVLKNGKGKKITVFTYRAKKGSKRKMGHRQAYTKIEIQAIQA